MKKILQIAVIFILGGVAFASYVSAQEHVIPITVPYEFTNLDPRIVKAKITCIVKDDVSYRGNTPSGLILGVDSWGFGQAEIDITHPSTSGSVTIPVRRVSDNFTVAGLFAYSERIDYHCYTGVTIAGNVTARGRHIWVRLTTDLSDYDYARVVDDGSSGSGISSEASRSPSVSGSLKDSFPPQ